MTLKTLYSLRIFFRVMRMALIFFAAIDGAGVVIGLFHREFNRDLLICATWTALYALLIIISTEAMRTISEKISKNPNA
jgi:hypothetical protein